MNKNKSILNLICIILIILGLGNIIFASIKLINLNSYLDSMNQVSNSIDSQADIDFTKLKISNGIKFYSIVLIGGQAFCFFSSLILLIKVIWKMFLKK